MVVRLRSFLDLPQTERKCQRQQIHLRRRTAVDAELRGWKKNIAARDIGVVSIV